MAAHHRPLILVAVPPLGFGEDLALPALLLILGCLIGMLHLRRAGGPRGRAASAALFCLLLVSLVILAVGLWRA